ncbi:hypothetical protein [Candidatus Mycoplasma haematominutum]|uniref:Lipoprotein n=1 Tax=Candidatus Mycoplasma haematominutum 'Birmingham 1' TaxID=1116213 RepID=G8C3S1_9MOLU|nr:hypothetical protein [Candidatus Mycoplasma haematominutum]CCE66969.1 hypothetical protein MHM_04510 [Candidatus Mycoplasma haematominutum 'Birmingham 1']
MKYFTPIVGGVVCTGGSACAIAVPVTLTEGAGSTGLVISKCQEEEITRSSATVAFGDKSTRRVCWKLKQDSDSDDEEESESTEVQSDENKLSEILMRVWERQDSLVSQNELDSNWKVECNDKKWKTESNSNFKFFGYCSSSGSDQNTNYPFLEVTGDTNSSTKLSVCFKGQNCFTDSTSSGTSTFKTKDANEWKELEFQKK